MLIRGIAALLLVATSGFALAEDQKNPDALMQELMELGPEAVAAHIAKLKGEVAVLEQKAKALRDEAAALDTKSKQTTDLVMPYVTFLESMAPKPAEVPAAAAAMAPEEMEEPKTEATMAKGERHVNFMDDIMPIFEQRCVKCHRDDKREGGLTMSTFANLMNGGSSGQVLLAAGDPSGSRLFQMVLQEIDPIMPPRGNPLDDDQLDLIEKWINSGMRERSDSKVKVAKKQDRDIAVFSAAAVSDGPPPMPEVQLAAFQSDAIRPSVARAMAVSPTATLMALGGDKQIILYNTETFELIGALPFDEGEIYTMTFSLNGEMLFAGGGTEGAAAAAVLYNVRTGERVGSYGRGFDTILAGDISPDHRMLAVGGPNRKVRVYDTASGDLLLELESHTDWIYAIKFSPDGELLSSADRAGGVFFWQAANGRAVETVKGHNKAVNDMDYSANSALMATAGEEGEIIIWDTWKYSQVRKINAHNGRVLSLDYRPDGQLISSGADGLTKRWGADGKEVAKYEKRPDWAYQTRFAKDGTVVLTADWRGEIVAFDTEKGEKITTLSTKPQPKPAPAEQDKVAQATD